MAQTRWHRERVREGYYKQARREGYRARSAYKLKQIQNKFRILRRGDAVADLGCAPGGWSQVLAEIVGEDGLVVGVDLKRTLPLPGVQFLKGDFTRQETRDRLWDMLRASGRNQLDCVVSDMAPEMSGNYDLDQARSVHLSTLALEFAVEHLRPRGSFCCKVFEGADFQEFRDEVRRHFGRVQTFHPPASRKQSSEVYVIAKGLRRATDASGDEEE